jgi:hypothetical protein
VTDLQDLFDRGLSMEDLARFNDKDELGRRKHDIITYQLTSGLHTHEWNFYDDDDLRIMWWCVGCRQVCFTRKEVTHGTDADGASGESPGSDAQRMRADRGRRHR